MKNATTLLFLCLTMVVFGQEAETYNLWEVDSTWSKETFYFPISFAKEIPLKGYEDARFPKGWGDKNSPEFWSYIFAWSIDRNTELKVEELETYLQYYFDGLMNVVNKDPNITIPNTTVLILTKNRVGTTTSYVGKVRVYDAFRTKKPIVLYINIDQYYCKQEGKSTVGFRFSPKPFGDAIWNTLKAVKLSELHCENK